MIERLRDLPGRTKVFIALAVGLVVLASTGSLQSDRDVEVERDEAIEIALPHIDFEPEVSAARLFRQGSRLEPVWAVSFSIPLDGSSREFKRHTTVEVHARTGEVMRISVDNLGEVDREADEGPTGETGE